MRWISLAIVFALMLAMPAHGDGQYVGANNGEVIIHKFNWRFPSTSPSQVPTWDTTACMALWLAEARGTQTCSSAYVEMRLTPSKSVTLTRLSVAVDSLASVNQKSCNIRITKDEGVTDAGSTELATPGANPPMAVGDVYESTFSLDVDAGETIQLQLAEGDTCQTGPCECGGGQGNAQVEIWGVYTGA